MTYPHHPRFGSTTAASRAASICCSSATATSRSRSGCRPRRAWQIETLAWVAAHARRRPAGRRAEPPRRATGSRSATGSSVRAPGRDPDPHPADARRSADHGDDPAPGAVRRDHGGRSAARPTLVPPTVADHLRAHGLARRAGAGRGRRRDRHGRVPRHRRRAQILEAGALGEIGRRLATRGARPAAGLVASSDRSAARRDRRLPLRARERRRRGGERARRAAASATSTRSGGSSNPDRS